MKRFLFVTANKNEANALLKDEKFFPHISNEHSLLADDKNFYDLGYIENYEVVHFRLRRQGSARPGASQASIEKAIRAWKPDAVILLGIAFGKQKESAHKLGQQIGDVLIAETIQDYESGRVGKDSFRKDGKNPDCGEVLLSVFQNFCDQWQHSINGRLTKCYIGKVLSGDKVVDNKEFKRGFLFDLWPEAIGGEMEGRGAYAACIEQNLHEWIVVKAICDWGENKQNPNKQHDQELAAQSVVSLIKFIFSHENAFEKLPTYKTRKAKFPNKAHKTLFADKAPAANTIDQEHPIMVLLKNARKAGLIGAYNDGLSVAHEAYSMAMEIDDVNKDRPRLLAETQYALANLLSHNQQNEEAWPLIVAATQSKELKQDSEKFLLAIALKAFIALQLRKYIEAEGAIKIAREIDTDNDDLIFNLDKTEAFLLLINGRNDEALKIYQANYEKSVAGLAIIGEDCTSTTSQKYAIAANDLGIYYHKYVRDPYQALEWYRKAVEELRGKNNFKQEYYQFYLDYVDLLLPCGRAEEAVEKYNEIADYAKNSNMLGLAAYVYKQQSNAYLQLEKQDYKSAERSAEKAMDCVQNKKDRFEILILLAELYAINKQPDKSRAANSEAMAVAEEMQDLMRFRGANLQQERLEATDWFSTEHSIIEANDSGLVYSCSYSFEKLEELMFAGRFQDSRFVCLNEARSAVSNNRELSNEVYFRPSLHSYHRKKNNLTPEELKFMISKAEKEEIVSRKASMYCEIGIAYGQIGNLKEERRYISLADTLLHQVSDIKVKAIILQAKAHVLMNRNTFEDDQIAEELNLEAYKLVKNKAHIEVEIVCLHNLAILASRRFDTLEATRKFEDALSLANNYKDEFSDLIREISADLDYLNRWEKFKLPASGDLPTFSSELLYLQAWYPKYKNELHRYWQYARGVDVIRAITAQSTTKSVIVSENVSQLETISEVFRCLFVTQAYTAQIQDEERQIVNSLFPAPEGCSYPYSLAFEVVKKETDIRDVYTMQSDDTNQMHPFVAFPNEDPAEHDIDVSRKPKPVLYSFVGYDLPETTYRLCPMYFSDNSSMFWYLPSMLANSNEDLVVDTLNKCYHHKTIPVILNDDLRNSSTKIISSRSMTMPYSPYGPFEVTLTPELKSARKVIEQIVNEEQTTVQGELVKALQESLDAMPKTPYGTLRFQVALLEFPFRTWANGPTKTLSWPAITLQQSSIDGVDRKAVKRNIAIRKAEILEKEARFVELCDQDYIWSCYEQIDLLRKGELFSEELLAVSQAEIVDSLIEKYGDLSDKDGSRVENTIQLISRAIEKLSSLRNDGFEKNQEIAEIYARAYYVLGEILDPEKCIQCIDAISEIRNNGCRSNEQISVYLILLLSRKLTEEQGDSTKAIEELFLILDENPKSKQIAIVVALFIDQCFVGETNLSDMSAENAIDMLEKLQSKGFADDPLISFTTKIKRLYLHKTGENLTLKLNEIQVLMSRIILEMNFNKSALYTIFCKNLVYVDKYLSETDCNSLIVFIEKLISDENYSNESTAITAAKLLARLSGDKKSIKEIRTCISRIKVIWNHFRKNNYITVSLMLAYRSLLNIQKQRQKISTISSIRTLYNKLEDISGTSAIIMSDALFSYYSQEKIDRNEALSVLAELEKICQKEAIAKRETPAFDHVSHVLANAYYLAGLLHEAMSEVEVYEKMNDLYEAHSFEDIEPQLLQLRALIAGSKTPCDNATFEKCKDIILKKYIAQEEVVKMFISTWGVLLSRNNNSEMAMSLYLIMDEIVAAGLDKKESILAPAFFGYSNSVLYVAEGNQDACMDRFIELFAYENSPFLFLVIDFLYKISDIISQSSLDELCSIIQKVACKFSSVEEAKTAIGMAAFNYPDFNNQEIIDRLQLLQELN